MYIHTYLKLSTAIRGKNLFVCRRKSITTTKTAAAAASPLNSTIFFFLKKKVKAPLLKLHLSVCGVILYITYPCEKNFRNDEIFFFEEMALRGLNSCTNTQPPSPKPLPPSPWHPLHLFFFPFFSRPCVLLRSSDNLQLSDLLSPTFSPSSSF